jgi:1-deoxy-D-xylulose-5-phosphate reductoisomerase
MRIPIQYALSYPERFEGESRRMSFAESLSLTFSPPSFTKFPCLRLAFRALEKGGTWPAVLNAANEVAVGAFLEERIGFLQIPETIEATMEAVGSGLGSTLDEILAVDAEARHFAERFIAAGVGPTAIGNQHTATSG